MSEMNHYLVLKLKGVMQAWGGHTLEDLRHTEIIPTRSGLLGLLAACLGIDRNNHSQLDALAQSLRFTISIENSPKTRVKRITDFHTVKDARKVDGKRNKYPVVSRREYLCDAVFTILIEAQKSASFGLKDIAHAVQNPVYTPFLGRRSCPITRPLYEAEIRAKDIHNALSLLDSVDGTLYSDQRIAKNDSVLSCRDVPLYQRKRQFASRKLYLHPFTSDLNQTTKDNEDNHVPE